MNAIMDVAKPPIYEIISINEWSILYTIVVFVDLWILILPIASHLYLVYMNLGNTYM